MTPTTKLRIKKKLSFRAAWDKARAKARKTRAKVVAARLPVEVTLERVFPLSKLPVGFFRGRPRRRAATATGVQVTPLDKHRVIHTDYRALRRRRNRAASRSRARNLALLCLPILALALVACGGKPVHGGTVLEHRFTPAHSSTIFVPMSCGKRCMYVMPITTFDPDDYQLRVHDCLAGDQAAVGCRDEWEKVDKPTYDSHPDGSEIRFDVK